jgi:gliding motility-associated lipoprotein GldD
MRITFVSNRNFYFRTGFPNLTFFLILLVFVSCDNSNEYSPRPRGYFRIDPGKHAYQKFAPDNCPFSFDIPERSVALPDTQPRSEKCWYYLMFPDVNGQIYLTYKPLNNNLNQFAEDTRMMVYKHTSRASSIEEEVITFSPGVTGVVYQIGGEAASSLQFYVTDSSNHFLRGALYFNVAPNADSLKPVIDFVKEDVRRMLQTLKWK